ncbi:ATP-NAD kinase family protein [Aliidiomarina sanyensis]|uniref:ATP-NAD kinase n=1 Tax=Aliidiomarina sanyensis TaxID=1249555 RepID=A0A432WEL3_9GAMM|nr:ATP-NAD kinase family protein [Aliidiomarina sanyensis]RUO31324.1 ATP-NAD kinase [Aliidiomarina sanyensis]
MHEFRLGLVINPYAGIGGSVALKGSDGPVTRQEALARGAKLRAPERVKTALQPLLLFKDRIRFATAAGNMGADVLRALGFAYDVVYTPKNTQTEAEDTQAAVRALCAEHLDLLVFAGGDGTARDVVRALGEQQLPAVGIPAGVKIHSAVYAVSPAAAGKVLRALLQGELTTLRSADVMDLDEEAYRRGAVRAKRFGELQVPGELEYMQAVKIGGRESDELVLADIAADVIERMDDDALYIMGSGSTVAFIMDELGLPNTLLGVDVISRGAVIAQDVTGSQLEALVAEARAVGQRVYLVVTLIGGQGHIFGRGNQQLTPEVIRMVGREHIDVVATKRKLQALEGRPLRVDTGDATLDDELAGFIAVITGYHDRTMVAVEDAEGSD